MYVHECACEHKCTHVFWCVLEGLYALVCGMHLKGVHLCGSVCMYACISVSICVSVCMHMATVCVVSGLHPVPAEVASYRGIACQTSLFGPVWLMPLSRLWGFLLGVHAVRG